jgi:hypothetical protein
MNEQLARQTQEFLTAAVKTEVPNEVRLMALDGVAQLRDALGQWGVNAQKNAKMIEDMVAAAQAGAKTVRDQTLANFQTNTEAALAAADSLARAKTLPEAAHLQAKYVQNQLSDIAAQMRQLAELSAQVTKQTAETLTSIATSYVGDLKRA